MEVFALPRIASLLLRRLCFGLLLAGVMSPAVSAERFTFGVLSQRSAVLTAQYWNPILAHAGRKAGVELDLRVARTGSDSADAAEHGDYDFIFSNHIFQPRIAAVGYRVFARIGDEALTGQIVTLSSSPVNSLKDLHGREVGFPSVSAFVAYALPMDQLLRQGVSVLPVFGGNQEGIMAQLKAGRVLAAGVNGKMMKAYAEREGLNYRVLWESAPYSDMPLAAHPRVPPSVLTAVRAALLGMGDDPEGAAILDASARLAGQKPMPFRPVTPADYRNYTEFYKHTLVKELR